MSHDHAFLYWTLAQHVLDMEEEGNSREMAVAWVAMMIELPPEHVAEAIGRYPGRDMPGEEIFPIPEEDLALTKRLARVLSN